MNEGFGGLAGGHGNPGYPATQSERSAKASALGRLSLDAPTVKERYQEQLADAQRRVERITEILALLDKNTDTERLLTLIQQQGGY